MKHLIEKFLTQRDLVVYKIIWNFSEKDLVRYKLICNSGVKPEVALAVCKTREECNKVIDQRRKMWKDSIGYDITPHLEIVKFYIKKEN
jgi:hypothetical protein